MDGEDVVEQQYVLVVLGCEVIVWGWWDVEVVFLFFVDVGEVVWQWLYVVIDCE